jgi:hypothetical protein
MMVEPSGDPDQDLFALPDLSAYSPSLRGSISSGRSSISSSSSDSNSGSRGFGGIGLPPPPPPVQVVPYQQLILDPAEARRVASEATMEKQLLASLRQRKASGELAGAEAIQLDYLEARAASEAKRAEWESHQARVQPKSAGEENTCSILARARSLLCALL